MSIRELSEDLKSIAKEQLSEDENRLEEHLEHIRKWLKKQSHISAREGKPFLFFNIHSIFYEHVKYH